MEIDDPAEIERVPDGAAESFAGVANPFSLSRLARGERVLDLGCGAGTDSLVAAQMVGPTGSVTGIGNLVETYARSKFEDTREKALKFGARGTTVKAYKARR